MSKSEATVLARQLCKKLGKGWRPRVWWNPERVWHWAAVKCGITVYGPSSDYDKGRYMCLIGETEGSGGGLGAWAPENIRSRNPKLALRKALAGVNYYADKIAARRAAIVEAAGGAA